MRSCDEAAREIGVLMKRLIMSAAAAVAAICIPLGVVNATSASAVNSAAVSSTTSTVTTKVVAVKAKKSPSRTTAALKAIKPPFKYGSVKYNKYYAREYMKIKYGWGRVQYKALVKLFNRESGWNHRIANGSSGAYGIPQALPGNKMRSEGKDWRTNPQVQIRWGLKYIKAVYGKPTGAWAHSQSNNWY